MRPAKNTAVVNTDIALTGFDAVLERLFAVAEDLLEVLRILLKVQTVSHHLLQSVWMVEVQNFGASVVVLADVINEDVDDLEVLGGQVN